VPRDDPRPRARWDDAPVADPHRDVMGALHDVSNALTVLLGWAAEARAGGASPEQFERALAIIEDRARTARDLARRAIGAQAVVEDREELIDAVVDDVIEALSVESQRAGVTLTVAQGARGVRVPLAGDVSHILTNLILNALAWSPRGSHVRIATSIEASDATIEVQDEGPGVASSNASGVFEGTTERAGGAGVGLKHARALARAAGGTLELVAAQAARGARFRLRWPRLETTMPRAPVSAPRAAVLAGTRVLVVEDDVDVATLLETALVARGAHVVVARTAEELAQHAAERHDAALVDLSPIAHDVRGAMETLRAGSPGVALVLISGSAVGLPESLEHERIWWVRKPFEVGEIVAALIETRTESDAPSGTAVTDKVGSAGSE